MSDDSNATNGTDGEQEAEAPAPVHPVLQALAVAFPDGFVAEEGSLALDLTGPLDPPDLPVRPAEPGDIDAVAELIKLPDDHVMGPMVAIGKGTKEPWPKPGQLSLDEVVIKDRFGS